MRQQHKSSDFPEEGTQQLDANCQIVPAEKVPSARLPTVAPQQAQCRQAGHRRAAYAKQH